MTGQITNEATIEQNGKEIRVKACVIVTQLSEAKRSLVLMRALNALGMLIHEIDGMEERDAEEEVERRSRSLVKRTS